MDYKKYRAMGAGLIGSGAIESAHRTVVQKKNETIRTEMDAEESPKYADAAMYTIERAMEQSYQPYLLPT